MERITWKTVALVSLAVNVLIVGVVAGRMLHWKALHGEAQAELSQALTPENYTAFQELRQDFRREMRARHRESRAAHRQLLEILAAPEFDRTAYLAQAARMMALQRGGAEAFEAMADLAEDMSQREREALANYFRLKMERMKRRAPSEK